MSGHTEYFTFSRNQEKRFEATITAIRLETGSLIVVPPGDESPTLLDEQHATAEPKVPAAGIMISAREPSSFHVDFTETVI